MAKRKSGEKNGHANGLSKRNGSERKGKSKKESTDVIVKHTFLSPKHISRHDWHRPGWQGGLSKLFVTGPNSEALDE